MNETLANTFRIIAIILFLVALGIGGWFLWDRVLRPGGGGDETETQAELLIWGLWETDADFQVLIDAYQAQNPNVTITYIERDFDGYQETTLGRISSPGSQAPDIVMMHNSWRSEYEPFLVPIPSTVMTDSDYQNTFYETMYDDFKGANGGLYAIPLMYDGLGLYYNIDLFEAEGYTAGPEDNWEQLVAQAAQLTQYDSDKRIEIAGLAMGTSSNIQFSSEILNLLMLQQGAEPVNTDGTSGLAANTAAQEALTFYTDYTLEDKLWNDSLDDDIQMFAEGRLAMMFAPSWRVHDILSAKNEFLNFDVAPVPQLTTLTGEDINLASYWAFSVTKSSTNQDVAWDFLKFSSQPDQLRAFYQHVTERDEARAFGEIYPRIDMASELEGQKYVDAYIKMAKNGAKSWDMKKAAVMNQAFNDSIDRIVKDQSDPEEEIDRIVTIYNGLGTSTAQ